ncbi:Protein of unknown function [Palleronia salina]|uniref:DUF3306 domain-containing protein n=1 Tax=Palleronia salina TaxID=313368 RepID=A0A1M6GY09_9RHOB|nr:DUF3306 domain-containing protein [Palleronia salina]SHJ14790.1 Protein of unknown function [Palleronia salina]
MSARSDFWSRRRAAVADQDRAETRAREDAKVAEEQAALAERPEEEVLAELGLPSPESICSGDDVKAFMAKAVPDYLRRRALRTLWRSNPVLACLDGLNDYDGDFTNAATDAPGVQTAYRVGKGLQKHLDELARQASADEQDDDLTPETAPEQSLDEGATAGEDVVATAPAPEETPETDAADDTPADAPRPRRMAFRFDGGAA